MGSYCSYCSCCCCECCCCCKKSEPGAFSTSEENELGTANPLPPTLVDETPGKGNIYLALYKYDSTAAYYMSFECGDKLNLTDTTGDNWWFATSLDGKRRGYVPRTFLTPVDSIEAEEWYCGNLDRAQSETILLFLDNSSNAAHGAFLVRPSHSLENTLVLSVRVEDEIQHFRIHKDQNEKISLPVGNGSYHSVQALVQHHRDNADGLAVNLRRPIKQVELLPAEFLASHDWEIDQKDIEKGARLGEGSFGEVFKGKWLGNAVVAIKQMKGKTDDNFSVEIEKMKKIIHPNLIRLHGVCTKSRPYWIITEFMKNGDLPKFLNRTKNDLTMFQLFNIGSQVASGMAYLEAQNYVHRNLAARNILVGGHGEVKVADFGLSAFLLKPLEDLPLVSTLWTAPEALSHNAWSTKSDVWSFGIVLWEIFSFGDTPYQDLNDAQVKLNMSRGEHLDCPRACPLPLYDVMKFCWQDDPESRPTFDFLNISFRDFVGDDMLNL